MVRPQMFSFFLNLAGPKQAGKGRWGGAKDQGVLRKVKCGSRETLASGFSGLGQSGQFVGGGAWGGMVKVEGGGWRGWWVGMSEGGFRSCLDLWKGIPSPGDRGSRPCFPNPPPNPLTSKKAAGQRQ